MKYVDLGLPSGLLWAENNIGADEVGDYGLYFAWGDILGKTAQEAMEYSSNYSRDYNNYRFVDHNVMTKYNDTDNIRKLESVDDAAVAYLNDGSYTPSKDEWKELIDNVEITPTIFNDKKCLKLKSKNNDQYLLVPTSGWVNGGKLYCAGEGCILWTSELQDSMNAHSIVLSDEKTERMLPAQRYVGLQIRTVKK